MKLKTVIAQCAVETGHVLSNLNQMKEMIEQAKEVSAQMIVFPALCLSGACAADQWYNREFVRDVEACNDELKALSEDLIIVWGNISTEEEKLYETLFCAYQKEIMVNHRKRVLKDEGISEESRYFSCGENRKETAIELMNTKLAFVLGHEIEHDSFINKECDLLIHVDSTPWTLDDKGVYDSRMKELNLPCVLRVNTAGMQNTGKNIVMYDGASAFYQSGICTHALSDGFVKEWAVIEDEFQHRIEHKLMDCLVKAIYEFDRQTLPYGPNWIIGLSGGLDSSVTAALLTMAVGSKRIRGYNLATRYNSENTKDNAAKLAEALGIELRNGYISEVVEASVNTAKIYGYKEDQMPTLVHENIQARVRGHLLSTFAQIENGVIMNNGNKIEVALGYATMYGDSIGAIGPIGDLTKVQLFELSHEINEMLGKEVIPERLLPVVTEDTLVWEMAPSAELREAQYDPMKWFYHDWLISQLTDKKVVVEDIMEAYLDGSLQSSEIGRWLEYYHLLDGKAFIQDLEWVLRQMRVSIFKRVQSVPVVMVSRKAFGTNRHEVQGTFEVSARYQKLKEQILNR